MLKALEIINYLVNCWAIHREAQFFSLHGDRCTTRHFTDQKACSIANQFGCDVLVGILCTRYCRHMQASLVGKSRCTNIWRLRIERTVQHFGNKIAHRSEALQSRFWQAIKSHLQLQVWNHGGEIGVSRSLTKTIQCSLYVTSTALHCSKRVGNCATRVIMAMDSDGCIGSDVSLYFAHDAHDIVGQRSTIGVTQHQMRRTAHDRCFQHAE